MKPVKYAGLTLKNPVIISSATPAISAEAIRKGAQAGAAAVVTKSVIFPEANGNPAGGYPRPRFQLYNSQKGYDPALTEKGGLFSLFRLGEPYPTPDKRERMLDEVKKIKDVDIPIIVSICGSPVDYEQWRELARRMENAGADALEINMHAYPEIKYTDPLFVKVVKDEVKIPVICKLMSIHEDPATMGRKAEQAGADAIAALGTFGLRGVELNIETETPWMNMAHGMGGSWLRPVGLAFIETLARTVCTPLSGVTGVQTWRDAVKYILLGASTVQVCAAIYARGYKVITEIVDGLETYMRDHGYDSIADFRGRALANFKEQEYAPPIRAEVNPVKCAGCGKCGEICMFNAITMQNKKAVVNEKCDGCGLCWSYCPARAIEPVRYEEGGITRDCNGI